MTDVEEDAPPRQAPGLVLDTMHTVFVARAMYVVTDLGVIDLLAGGPRSAEWLAAELGVEAVPLHQLLRTLASTGLLRTEPGAETGPAQRYSLTEVGDTLREGHPTGTRELVLTMQGPEFWNALRVLPERVATGRTGPEIVYGMPFFEYLAGNPPAGEKFNRMMIATHGGEPAAVARAYDLSWAGRVVDVGGGIGTLLLAVLERNPHLTGVLFDRPDVIGHAEANLAGRCQVIGGDFLEAVPPGADAYLLSRILHDWDDDTCVRILRTCAAAMTRGSRLLVVEKVLPGGDEPHLGKMLDLVMVTMTHGRERTAGEYGVLLEKAGLRTQRLVPTDSASSVIEAVFD
ncbi:methyltransferase [Amycolatopsis lurida]